MNLKKFKFEICLFFKQQGYIVPFKPKLEKLLSMPEYDCINKIRPRIANNIYSQIEDGKCILIKLAKKKQENEESGNLQPILIICLYYDDMEVCSALGPARGKHKTGIYKSLKLLK